MKLQDVKIGKRLVAGYVVFILIIVLLCALGFKNTSDINRRSNEIVAVNFEKAKLAETAMTNLQGVNKELAKALITKNRSSIETAGEYRKAYRSALEKLTQLEKEKVGQDLIKTLDEAIARAREQTAKYAKLVEEDKWDEANALYLANIDPAVTGFIGMVGDIIKFQEKEVQERYQQIIRENQRVKIMLVIFGLVSLILCAVVAYITTKSITTPIERACGHLDLMSKGDFSIPVSPSSIARKDEMGIIARSIDKLNCNLKGMLTNVKTSSASVASASHQLSASAEQMSRGHGIQAERTIQVSTASEEMSQASLDIARNTNGIAASAQQMVTTAQEGNGIVNESVEEVKEIARTVNRSSNFVRELGLQSEKIGAIVSVINEIADQTNLLALNAAIEAARAGDAGRGFAVVADEVKKLSERTGSSTKEISDMITSIKEGVKNAVDSMEEASNSVQTGVELSNKAGVALNEIVTGATNLQSMVSQIATAIEEMNSTIDEIVKDISQVAEVTNESSNTAQDVTQAAGELSKLSIVLERSVEEFKTA